MRWISLEGNKLRLGRLAGSRQKRVYETWVCRCDHEQCRLLNGQRFLRGRGPQPRVTTPADCQCVRVPVPARRAQLEVRPGVVRRPARLAEQGFDASVRLSRTVSSVRAVRESCRPARSSRSAERVVSFVAQSCKDE